MKVLKVVLVVLAVMLTGFVLTGLLTPLEYHGQVSVLLPASKTQVWDQLIDIEHLPDRRKEIQKVEILGLNKNGNRSWKEYADGGQYMIFEVLELDYHKRMVINLQESSFGMTGTWSYDLSGDDSTKTNLTVTEDTKINNMFLRALVTLTGRNRFLKSEIEHMKLGLEQKKEH